MADSTWGQLWQVWGAGPRKRQGTAGRLGVLGAERLEERALLSAVGVELAGAEVVRESRAFDYPNVAGIWSLEIAEEASGTADVSQKGKKVTAAVSLDGVGDVTLKDKFTKKSPHTLSDTIKFNHPEFGKVTIQIEIEFPSDSSSPATLTGSVETAQGTFNFTGEKSLTAPVSASRAAPTFEDVSGEWDINLTSNMENVVGVMTVSQSGKGNKLFTGVIPVPEVENADLVFKGKFQKKSPFVVKGKATFTGDLPAKPPKIRFEIEFNIEYDQFGGTMASRQMTAEVSGTRVPN